MPSVVPGHAIAHRRHAAGLTDRIGAVQRFANDIRVVFIGLRGTTYRCRR